jgi:hypothetical protein
VQRRTTKKQDHFSRPNPRNINAPHRQDDQSLHNTMSYEMDLALPMLKEPVDQMREGLKAGGFQSEAAAPHPVQAFQATVRLYAFRGVGTCVGVGI